MSKAYQRPEWEEDQYKTIRIAAGIRGLSIKKYVEVATTEHAQQVIAEHMKHAAQAERDAQHTARWAAQPICPPPNPESRPSPSQALQDVIELVHKQAGIKTDPDAFKKEGE